MLFDHNNHKSNHHGPAWRVPCRSIWKLRATLYGFIGGNIDAHCFEESYAASWYRAAPGRARDERPFRLAVIQLGTYDGTDL